MLEGKESNQAATTTCLEGKESNQAGSGGVDQAGGGGMPRGLNGGRVIKEKEVEGSYQQFMQRDLTWALWAPKNKLF